MNNNQNQNMNNNQNQNMNNNSNQNVNNEQLDESIYKVNTGNKKHAGIKPVLLFFLIMIALILVLGGYLYFSGGFTKGTETGKYKTSSWNNSIKLLVSSIELNSNLFSPTTKEEKYAVDKLCSDTSKFKEIVDVVDMSITCNLSGSKYVFTVKGIKQFDGYSSKVTCTNVKDSASCTINQN